MKKTETKLSLAVIAPWGLDQGFRLGGASVKTVSNEDSLNRKIELIYQKQDTGILAIPETMKDWINEMNMKIIEKSLFPVIVYYRYPGDEELVPEPEEEVDEVVERAIGFRLKIRM